MDALEILLVAQIITVHLETQAVSECRTRQRNEQSGPNRMVLSLARCAHYRLLDYSVNLWFLKSVRWTHA